MITKNYKARVATLLQMTTNSSNPGGGTGLLSVKDVGGTTRYINYCNNNSFPYAIASSVSFNTNVAGIQVGTGSTAATEDDYKLETQITSGVRASSTTQTCGVDSSGNPYLEYLFTLTNTTSSDITVREIGYVQQFRLADTQGGSQSSTARYLLLDRTVLDTPVTVPANDSAAIKYTLKTVLASS
jgi:hypothetical protein